MTSKHERRNKLASELEKHDDADKVIASVKLLEKFMLDTLPARAESLKFAGYQVVLERALAEKHISQVLEQYPEIKAYIVSDHFKHSEFFKELSAQQKDQMQTVINDVLKKSTFGHPSQQSTLFHTSTPDKPITGVDDKPARKLK